MEQKMKYSVELDLNSDGEYIASCSSMGISTQGLSAQNALDALRAEIRYRIELCPCSTVEEDWIELDVVES